MIKFEGSKKDIAKKTGLSQRKIHYYTDFGLVIPDIANPGGRGTTRIYSFENIVDFLLVSKLVKFGLNLKNIKIIMDDILKNVNKKRWFSGDDKSLFYLLIYDLGKEEILIEMRAHEDPALFRDSLKKTSIKSVTDVPVKLQDRESVLVLNLSKIAEQARKTL